MKRNENTTILIIIVLYVYILLNYIETTHCTSVVHLHNLKYCDAQNQICTLTSHLETNINHNDIDEEVEQLVDEDIINNLIQQYLLNDIRNFNVKIENAMKGKY